MSNVERDIGITISTRPDMEFSIARAVRMRDALLVLAEKQGFEHLIKIGLPDVSEAQLRNENIFILQPASECYMMHLVQMDADDKPHWHRFTRTDKRGRHKQKKGKYGAR